MGPLSVGSEAKSSVVKMNSMLGRRCRSGKAIRARWRELRVARARDAVAGIGANSTMYSYRAIKISNLDHLIANRNIPNSRFNVTH